MNNLWLVVKREFLVRVRKKTFILTTLLTPLGFGLLMFISGYVASKGATAVKNIVVKDDSGVLEERIKSTKTLQFNFSQDPLDSLKNNYKKDGAQILLHMAKLDTNDLDKVKLEYITDEKLGLSTVERIESRVSNAVREYKIDFLKLDRSLIDGLKTNITLENKAATDDSIEGEKSSKLSIIIGTVLGGLMGFLMYMVIFIYGGMVMRSVMEEKINRIVEVMISSVKPFHLMMGKLLGVGGVGLLQLSIWIILIPLILFIVQLVIGVPDGMDQMEAINEQMAAENLKGFDFNVIMEEFLNQNWALIIPSFIMFFFGGYFLYSSLFAAIGSAVGDDMGESQQLMMPVMIPIIIAFILAQPVIQNPNGPLAIFGSMFPLFSPIIMPVRLGFNPPIWQVVLSIVILFLSCVFFAWLAGRIYRVGILMYGKKVNFKEIGKWLFYKN